MGAIAAAGAGALGSIVGGIAGQQAGVGARGEAHNDQVIANQLIQDLQNAPDASRPLILEKYRQAGLLSPTLESAISAGPSAMSQVATGGVGNQAQLNALKQMQERAAGGMTAQDRAALAQAQQQAATETNAKQAQIMQQYAQRGQGGQGAQLAAQLAAAQGGSNQAAMNALQIMGQSQQQALQAGAQAGQMGYGLEGQQFGEQAQKAQAADQMQRFNIQNQIANQQRNVSAQNQAQTGNLANMQGITNQNTAMQNQELQRQRQGEQTNFQNANQLAGLKSGAYNTIGSQNMAAGNQAAQAAQNLYSGIGGGLGSVFGAMGSGSKGGGSSSSGSNMFAGPDAGAETIFAYDGGKIQDYRNGGPVAGKASVPGDDPRNDTVDAKLSPGEIVVPRSLAQTSIGDKLMDLLKAHHEVKTHLDKVDEKSKKQKQKLNAGGPVMGSSFNPQTPQDDAYMQNLMNQFYQRMSPHQGSAQPPMTAGEMIGNPPVPTQSDSNAPVQQLADGGMVNDGFPEGTPQAVKDVFTPEEYKTHLIEKEKQKGHSFLNEANPPPVPSPSPSAPGEDLRPMATKFFQNMAQQPSPGMSKGGYVGYNQGYADGGQIPEKGSRQYLEYLMGQLKPPTAKKGYADGTPDEPIQAEDEPTKIPVDFEEPSTIEGSADEVPSGKGEIVPQKSVEDKEAELSDIKGLGDKLAQEEPAGEKTPASEESTKPSEESKEPKSELDSKIQTSGLKNDVDTTASGLKKAQDEREQRMYLNQMQQYAALAGSGLSKTDPTQALNIIKEEKGMAGLPVQSYEEQIANQQNDPNSPMSQVVRKYMTDKGLKVPDSASASDLFKVAPFLAKDTALQAQLQKTLLQQGVKVSEGEKNRKAAMERTIASQGNKKDLASDRSLTQTQQLLESARGNPAAAQAEKDLYSTQKVLSQMKVYSDLNKIPDAQVNLIISEVGKIATGGVPTGHEQEALKPNTPASKLSKLWGQLTNKPTSANAGAYLQEFKKYNEALAKDAQKVIEDKYGRIIQTRKSQLKPNDYQSLQEQYINRFKQPAQESSGKSISQEQYDAYSQKYGPAAAQKLLSNGYSIGQ